MRGVIALDFLVSRSRIQSVEPSRSVRVLWVASELEPAHHRQVGGQSLQCWRIHNVYQTELPAAAKRLFRSQGCPRSIQILPEVSCLGDFPLSYITTSKTIKAVGRARDG
jgi:hypothetical protein